MNIVFHKHFKKGYARLLVGEQKKFKERKDIFLKNPFDSTLNNHPFQGRYRGYRSINITGDLRAIYRLIEKNKACFVAIDTHAKLYTS